MALTGRLLADFSSFKQAAEQAQVSLRGMETGAGKVSTSLNRMVDSFSGRKLIQDATLMTEAINRIGGASVLTASEQKRVNDKVTEAIEKYRALGQQAPADMLKLADATKQVEKAQGGFVDQLKASIPTTQSLIGQVQTLALGYVSGMVALQGFERVGRAAFDFIVGSIKAYTDSEDATRRLTTALRSAGEATPETIKQFEELSKQYQRTTVFSDELIKETESLLVQVGQVLPSEMDQALNATTNLASGLGIDLRSATLLVARAFEDNFTALKKAGVVIDETRAKSEGMSYVLGQIQQRFGGQAQSEAASYAGQIKQLGNEFDDFQEIVGKVIVQTGLLQSAMLAAKVSVTILGGEITRTAGEFNKLLSIVGTLGSLLPGASGDLFRKQADLSKFVGGEGESIESVGRAVEATEKRVTQSSKNAQDDRLEYAKAKLQEWADEVRRHNEEYKDAEKEVTDFLEEQATIRTDDAKFALGEWSDAIKRHNDEYKVAEKEVTDFLAEQDQIRLDDAKRELDDWGEAVRRHVDEQKKADEEVTAFLAEQNGRFADSIGDLSRAFGLLAQISGDSWGGVIKDIATAVAAMQTALEAVKAIEKAMQSVSGGGFKGFSPTAQKYINTAIVGATTGYQVAAMTGTRSSAAGIGAGAASGAAAGSVAGPWGAAVGAIAGAIGGYLAARKAAKELRDANNEASKSIAEMQKQLIAQYGPLENIARLGEQVGVGLAGAWGDQSIEGLRNFQALTTEFQTKVKALQDAVEEFGLTWQDLGKDQQVKDLAEQANALALKIQIATKAGYDLDKVVGGAAGQLNDLLARAIATGGKLPASLEPYIRKLIESKQLTEDNARAMLGMAKSVGPSLDEVRAAADRYGLTLEDLGAKAMQLQITEQANQAAADWKVLSAVAGDLGVVMNKMQPEIQDIVSNALKFGAQLPESMKPLIEQMVKAGLLTDDTGGKLTDLTKLTFAQDLTAKISDLIDVMKKFVETITGDVGGALSDLAKTKIEPIEVPWYLSPSGGDFAPGTLPTPTGATGYAAGGLVYAAKGWPWRPRGTDTVPAMLTPGERVLSLAETAKYDAMMSGGSYRPPPIIVKTYLDGRQVAESTVPHIPAVVKKFGLTR